MSGIVLSSAIRSNLSTLQNTSALQGKIQERLSTGKKVNSAIDSPSSFFTASSLNRRATDLSSLLDSMQQGVKTLEAADNAMKAITKNVEAMQAKVRETRQDKSFKSASFSIDASATGNLQLSGGSLSSAVSVPLTQGTQGAFTATNNFAATTLTDVADTIAFDITVDGGSAKSITINQSAIANVGDGDGSLESAAEFQEILTDQGVTGVTASLVGGKLTLTSASRGTSSNVTISNYVETDADTDTTDGTSINAGASAAGAATGGPAKTVDMLVASINDDLSLKGKVKASNDGGKIKIENLSTGTLTLTGVSATDGEIDGTAGTKTIDGNDARKALINQFNDLRKELDKLANDASYNGINLLKADKLKITFNETGTSSIDVQAKNVSGTARGIGTESTSLDIGEALGAEFSDDAQLDARLEKLSTALSTMQTQSSEFGAALTTVQNRQDFTKAMIGTLQTGADSLVLADANEEAAKLLSLNTRQQLSQTALSLASQADQAVLRLF